MSGCEMTCPQCGKLLNPQEHQDLVFDDQVYCSLCRAYDYELVRLRPGDDIRAWCRRICQAFGEAPVSIEVIPALMYPQTPKLLVAEVHHRQRFIELYTPGLCLATLCHELAHLFTAEDHTPAWAQTFAKLVAWVKGQLPPLKKQSSSLN
jgi:hypothetical protein